MTQGYSFVDGAPPAYTTPTMIVMLTGWIDASGAAASAMASIESESNAQTIAVFDGDLFIDYRARRPTMELRDAVNTRVTWPQIEVKAGRDMVGNDVLLLTGPEPDMAWHRFGREAAELAASLGVQRMVALGSYPFATPHTRPSRLSLSTPSDAIAQSSSLMKSSVDVPAGVAAVLEHTFHDIGIEALGIWVQVPHYIASMAYPAATLALIAGLQQVGGIRFDGASARQETIIQRARLDELVAGNDEHGAMVTQLETLYDNLVGPPPADELDGDGQHLINNPDGGSSSAPAISASDIPTADELAAEFEQFLRDQNGN